MQCSVHYWKSARETCTSVNITNALSHGRWTFRRCNCIRIRPNQVDSCIIVYWSFRSVFQHILFSHKLTKQQNIVSRDSFEYRRWAHPHWWYFMARFYRRKIFLVLPDRFGRSDETKSSTSKADFFFFDFSASHGTRSLHTPDVLFFRNRLFFSRLHVVYDNDTEYWDGGLFGEFFS